MERAVVVLRSVFFTAYYWIASEDYSFQVDSEVIFQQGTRCRVQGTKNPEPGTWTLNLEHETLPLIKTAIQRASRRSSWKNKCLISSLAARRMLNKRKIQSQLSLGVAKGGNGQMIAHAWLKVGDFEIVEKSGEYQELYLF